MFLSGPISLLPFEKSDTQAAGSIRAILEASGKPIGAYDVLLAGLAQDRQLTLVIAVREFPRVKGLSLEVWAKG